MREQVLEDLIKLTGYSDKDRETLKEFSAQTTGLVDEFVKGFYDTLFAYKPTAVVFEENERQEREKTLKGWLLTVLNGDLNDDFFKNLWIVGLLHIKRGVPNSYMLGMVSLVQQLFLSKCLESFEKADAERLFGAFKRLMDVVAGIIAEGYYLSYVEALSNVAGIKKEVVDRMINIEIDAMIKVERGG